MHRALHYAWIVLGVTFVTLLADGGAARDAERAHRAARARLRLEPRDHLAAPISLNLLLYGLLGPFGAALMQRFGIRRTALGALGSGRRGGAGEFASSPRRGSSSLTWGAAWSARAAALVAPVFGATIVNRWFARRRGLAMGIVSASSATGQLLFLPPLAAVAANVGWRPVIWIVAAAMAAVIPLVALLLPERPGAMWAPAPYGDTGAPRPPPRAARRTRCVVAFSALGRAVGVGQFLAAVRELLRLRRERQRPGRHASHPVLLRPRHPRGDARPGCSPRSAPSPFSARRCRAGCRTATTIACC